MIRFNLFVCISSVVGMDVGLCYCYDYHYCFYEFSVEVYAEFNVIEHYGLLIFAGVSFFVIWDIL